MNFLDSLSAKFQKSKTRTVYAHHLSQTGTMHIQDAIPNQDSSFFFLRPKVSRYRYKEKRPRSWTVAAPGVFCAAVFDGHGPDGESASSLASERMQMAINRLLKDDNKFALNYILLKSFEEVAAALDSADCSKDSGTTASVVLLRNEDLAIANVGDSSVLVLAQHQWRRTRTIRFESMNHRPSNADELERIKAAGGRTYGNYVVDEEAKNGLAVTRTLGDRDMRKYGCISTPDITHLKLEETDLAVIVASDGFWDEQELTMQQVLDSVPRRIRHKPIELCHSLMNLVSILGGPTDDCTIVCLTLR